MDWSKYFIGIDHHSQTRGLFIGTGKLKSDGTIKYNSKSEDRTYEIVNAVGRFMRMKLNKSKDKKPYYGYDLPRCGKLVLIKPGYDFYVKRENRSGITQPIADF